MGTPSIKKFISKVEEVQVLFGVLENEQQESCLKLLAALLEKCTQIRWSGSLQNQYSSFDEIIEANSFDAADFVDLRHAPSETVVQPLVYDIIDGAVQQAEDKQTSWPSSRLRERKPSQQNFIAADDAFYDDTDDNECDYDYDSEVNIERRKRKQRFPKRTVTKHSALQKRSRERSVVGNASVVTRSSTAKSYPKPANKFIHRSTMESEIKQTVKPAPRSTVKHESRRVIQTEPEPAESKLATSKFVSKMESKPLVQLPLKKQKIHDPIINLDVKRSRGRPPKRKLYSCDHCSQTFTHVHSLYSHVTIHGEVPTSCRFCKKEFLNTISFDIHRCQKKKLFNLKQPSAEKLLRLCRVCGDEFKSVKLLQAHMKAEHGMNSHVPNYVCKFCNKAFVKKVSMYSHYKEHAEGKLVCTKCGEFCDNFEVYSLHMNEHEKDAKFTCEACGLSFIRAQQYEQHLKAHERHDCPKCGKSLSSRKALIKHCRVEHHEKIQTEERIHECDVCNKKFARPGMLVVHKRIHTGEKPVECIACKLFFRTTKALAKHRQTYTHCLRAGEAAKERRFLCSECGKAYFRKHALQRHMRYHTGEKPHQCQHCGYRCREANNLKRHMALHFEAERNFVCEWCGSAFHAKKTLEMHHSYKHSDVRSYECPDCMLTFKATNALKRHMKVHSVAKEHKCWCGTAFKRMYNLRRHLKSVHGTDEMLPPVRRVSTLDTTAKTPISKTDLVKRDAGITEEVSALARSILKNEIKHNGSFEEVSAIARNIVESHVLVPILTSSSSVPSVPSQAESRISTPIPVLMQDIPNEMRYDRPSSTASENHPTMHQQLTSLHPIPHSLPPPQHSTLHTDDLHRIRYPAVDSILYDTHQHHQLHTHAQQHAQNCIIDNGHVTVHGPESIPDRQQTTSGMDVTDPYNMQINTSMNSNSIIPQAVAYSSIMREYGGQFPFLQDNSVYSFVK